MKTNIALTGFMGSGKSAAGILVAEKLGKQFVETDYLIEMRCGKTIPQIFQEQGEISFREMEIEVIKEIAGKDNQVIACGGGVVLNSINIDRLKQNAVVIWLTASAGTISRRTGLNGELRPVLKQVKSLKELRDLMQYRKPFYVKAADLKVDTSRLNIHEVAEQIIEAVKKYT
jgi:shikimate kinase